MVTQDFKNVTKYAVSWYNRNQSAIFRITYFLIRLMEHIKKGRKSINIFKG